MARALPRDYVPALFGGLVGDTSATTWDRAVRTWKASDLACPACPAVVGEICEGARFCPERMRLLADKRDEIAPEMTMPARGIDMAGSSTPRSAVTPAGALSLATSIGAALVSQPRQMHAFPALVCAA